MDFNEERVDLAIYYGAARYPDLHQERLMAETLQPVCSEAYQQQHRLTSADRLSAAGKLVAIGDQTVASPFGYDLICPKENLARPRFRAFSEWLRSQCRADMPAPVGR